MWLTLLPYLLSGQPLWVQDGDDIGDAWHGRIAFLLPDVLILEATNRCDHGQDSTYLVTIPMDRVRAVRERYPSADSRRLQSLYEGPDAEAFIR